MREQEVESIVKESLLLWSCYKEEIKGICYLLEEDPQDAANDIARNYPPEFQQGRVEAYIASRICAALAHADASS